MLQISSIVQAIVLIVILAVALHDDREVRDTSSRLQEGGAGGAEQADTTFTGEG